MGKAPSAPDPQVIANSQTSSNRDTAIAQSQLNMVNQTDALGNTLNYTQNGTWADGTPRYSATQSLSPGSQQLVNTGQKTQQNLANLAQEQSGRLSGLLNQPLDWSAQQGFLNDVTNQALDKSWDRQSQQFETDLVNRGIRPGSTQYQNQLSDFQTNRSNAYNQANVANYNTALQSQLALRQAPLNEILALSGQGQVQGPQFANTGQTGVAGTDVAGIANQGYQNQMGQYQQNQGVLGGLFSAGASLLPMFSDERLKTNIVKVGDHPVGVSIYDYDWIDTGIRERGVLAQELQKVRPDLVDDTHESGYLRVDYYRLGMR